MANNMSNLLKWSIENSANGASDPPASGAGQQPTERPGLDPELLAQLLGGPSDADLMRESMAAITSPDIDLENRLVAFDNFEQLVENLDNANNMEALGLWTPLVGLLASGEPEMRMMACWCLGTAVQNNVKSQERMYVLGAIPTLAKLAVEDTDAMVRRKAILALSSGVRNYQPALDSALKSLDKEYLPSETVDAADMDSIDTIMTRLREKSAQKA